MSNLFALNHTQPEMWVAYHRGKTKYKKDPRYNKLQISYLLTKVVDALEQKGYIEHYLGFYSATKRVSRMRATHKLMTLLIDCKINEHMIARVPDSECIILKADKGSKEVPYTDNNLTTEMRRNLCAYNTLLQQTLIEIPECSADTTASNNESRPRLGIHSINRHVRRVFNGDWVKGGRFWGGWWQGLSPEWRSRITINESPVVELDYAGFQVSVLYALNRIDYWKTDGSDPYELTGKFENNHKVRDLLKLILTIAINAKDRESCRRAVQGKINLKQEKYGWFKDAGGSLDEVIADFANRHPTLPLFCQMGRHMQNIDSSIAEVIIDTLTDKRIPCLCIHDSFIVERKHEHLLHNLMTTAYQNFLGLLVPDLALTPPKIKASYSAFDVT